MDGGRALRGNTWPRHIGIMNDFVRIPHANGSSFASQFLYREFVKRGHKVTVVGPTDPEAVPERDFPPNHVLLPSVPFRTHPGVRLPLPGREALKSVLEQRFDVVLGQTCSELNDLGVWLRRQQKVPFLSVNTVHFQSAYNVLLPDAVLDFEPARKFLENKLVPFAEQSSVKMYNDSDGLIVLSSGLRRFWRERGVETPIHVIPRSVDPKIFDATHHSDPFAPAAKPGFRLLVVCRHTREKNVERLIRLFANWVAPAVPEATLTLVGDGPDHDVFRDVALECGVADKCFFPGEFAVTDIPGWYRHADVFVYPSLSETYGQVVSEAKWCGLPVVALADHMGVSDQVNHGEDGFLVEPGPDEARADQRFGKFVNELLRNPMQRAAFARAAEANARDRSDPARCIERYYEVFEEARKHCAHTVGAGKPTLSQSATPLARWVWVQGIAATLGLLRSPQVVNRHGRKQPTWDLDETAEAFEAMGDTVDAFERASDTGKHPILRAAPQGVTRL